MSDSDPQAAEGVAAARDAGARPLAPASRWVRLMNYLLDSVVSLSLALAAAQATVQTLGGSTPAEQAEVQELGALAWLATQFAYYVGCEYFFQRTPAKYLTCSIVCDYQGRKPGLGRILIRNLARLIPFDPVSFAFGRSHPRGWHDLLSGTIVSRAP